MQIRSLLDLRNSAFAVVYSAGFESEVSMSSHIQQTINTLQEELRRQLDEVAETKRVINGLCKRIGAQALYPDADKSSESGFQIRRDQWYGQSLATAMREYLLMRRAAGHGPATVAEIHDALTSGGFSFETKDSDNAKRGIRISLTKNTALFHRLPGAGEGVFGLIEWYPEAKAGKREKANGDDKPSDGEVPDSLAIEKPLSKQAPCKEKKGGEGE
jgi:hypothetical protein